MKKFEEDISYCIKGATVRTFKGKKFLSSFKSDFEFEKIGNIGEVERGDGNEVSAQRIQNV